MADQASERDPRAHNGPVLFLSHAGADAEAALDLALRIERTPAAHKAGLKVWIDQRDLVRGRGWQQQLEDAIEKHSSGFAVLLGSRGVVNWVESEVRVALSRATKDANYPFIPILVGGTPPLTCRPLRASTMGLRLRLPLTLG